LCVRIQFNVANKGAKFAAFCYKYRMIKKKCLDGRGSVLKNSVKRLVPLRAACMMLLMSSVYTLKLQKHTFQTRSQICEKRLLARSCLPVRPSVRVLQLGSYWTDFHEILYCSIFRKSDEKTHVPLMLISR